MLALKLNEINKNGILLKKSKMKQVQSCENENIIKTFDNLDN